jgi:flagellar hook assembly protein FlgD
VEKFTAPPDAYILMDNYPNPFNATTVIRFLLSETIQVKVAVYNITGQEIAVVADNEYPSGLHSVTWNGKIHGGQPASSGIYFYRMFAGSIIQTSMMTLVK